MDNYNTGDRIELVYTSDPYTKLVSGDQGTVTAFSPLLDQLHVKWDTGSKLTLLIGEDEFRKL